MITRKQRINYLARLLKSNPDWVEGSLYDNDGEYGMGDMLWHSNEDIAGQLYKMGFTHMINGEYVRSHPDQILTMLEDTE